ncbi:leucine/isoleucine/valine transporter permease subunit [mine drainage metagenome]|uniref:Leucine/isoleucine/valine transporter permease subunit n=1 Tax=mine drainage metagenome TaxID=410659 RepID=A0A1J5QA31_9ZZZZ
MTTSINVLAKANNTRSRSQSLASLLGGYTGLLLLACAPLALMWNDPYWINILAYAYLFGALAAAWNIIGGFGGQFSLGHGVFFAIGAYTVARLYLDLGLTPWLGIFPAAALATLVAVLISWPTFRLRGPFFAIATMAINEACFALANYSDRLTGGPRGILVPFRAGFSNMIFAERWKYALLTFGFMTIVVLITVFLRRSRLGHYLLAVREDEEAARAAGIDVLKVKLLGMALSAALTGAGGGIFAMYVRVLDPPTLFSLPDIGVKFALISLIGGIGTIMGPVVGALLIVPPENFLRGALGGEIPGGHLIVLGIILVGASLFLKRGLVGAFTGTLRRIRDRRQP